MQQSEKTQLCFISTGTVNNEEVRQADHKLFFLKEKKRAFTSG